jgi:hypothetical protein
LVKNKFIMSKKLLFLLIILTPFTNLSYASFPIIADTLEATIDTLQTEEIKQYHSNLIKMGIELSSCKCESCRNGIAPLTKNGKEVLEKNKMNIWIQLLIIMTILSIVLVILLFRWAENFNKSGGIGG